MDVRDGCWLRLFRFRPMEAIAHGAGSTRPTAILMSFDYSRKNKRWRRLRELALARDGELCQESLRYGKTVTATEVHHIWPAEEYPEYAYCLWNLVSLSKAKHDAMHERLTRRLTPLGESWRRRTIPPGLDQRD